jgi:hypothetical protein
MQSVWTVANTSRALDQICRPPRDWDELARCSNIGVLARGSRLQQRQALRALQSLSDFGPPGLAWSARCQWRPVTACAIVHPDAHSLPTFLHPTEDVFWPAALPISGATCRIDTTPVALAPEHEPGWGRVTFHRGMLAAAADARGLLALLSSFTGLQRVELQLPSPPTDRWEACCQLAACRLLYGHGSQVTLHAEQTTGNM